MERLRTACNRLCSARRTALVPFIMGGDPSLEATKRLIVALEAAGADVIEIGVPFSDPLADGPIIQAASARALARGARPRRIFSAVASVRSRVTVPLVCLTYWNPVLQFGRPAPQAFFRAAHASGFDGVIVPDLPIEAAAAAKRSAAREDVATIFLAAPTSPPPRLRAVARASEGFIYYVSVIGTTGVRRALPAGLLHGVRQLKLLTTKPVYVGFGISTPGQAARVGRAADGVIIGSALIHVIAAARGRSAVQAAASFVARMRRAVGR
ncbi:MAG: tryptophan synthase subunit alpha [Candidatus Omnitrophica bacterium]|nr:tryptophan synthase subunit alpha [Candidatus Omnitrophota bacterium]